jgi:phosphoribosylaminoimidazole-succinocarboxamide synthase
LANECLPEDMAAWWIDVQKARKTALGAFNALQKFLNPRGIELIDICFFISQDGSTILSEVSPDCGRYRSLDGESLDKDVWRRGGSHTEVLEKWQRIIDMIS